MKLHFLVEVIQIPLAQILLKIVKFGLVLCLTPIVQAVEGRDLEDQGLPPI
jgi:hypothetical protein